MRKTIMNLNVKEFYQATNPARTLSVNNDEDNNYYIDFSSVRGEQIIEDITTSITWAEEGQFVHQLFTGHMGCGKSTELLRLKRDLEQEKFYVVYFESEQELDIYDADINDILLVIARKVSRAIELEAKNEINQENANMFRGLVEGAKKILLQKIEINLQSGEIPGVGKIDLKVDTDNNVNFTLSTLLGKISASSKNNQDIRDRLRNYLGHKTDGILELLNEGLFKPAIKALDRQNKKGLVVIMDNLDRLGYNSNGRSQAKEIFATQGEKLNRLFCHVIYTMPLALRYSNDYQMVKEKFKGLPLILPMIPTKLRNGDKYEEGMELLKQMVLARALPKLAPEERTEKILEIFDCAETLDYLCYSSGGHVRNLLRLLHPWIRTEKRFPLSRVGLDAIIINELNELVANISHDEWELLRQVSQEKNLNNIGRDNNEDYEKLITEKLIGNLSIYEYRDKKGSWYDINPILALARELTN
jgi:hypothetical protein